MNSPRPLLNRSFLVFLLLGLGLRLWNLPDPVIDAMAPRQAQTADAIRSLIEEPGFQVDSNSSWTGTSGARIVLELPVYNLLTQSVYEVLDFAFHATHSPKPGGADPHLIDLSARLVSVVFWVLTFLLLQSIWSRFLSQRETFWANGVFVFAPLSVFFGQAVMPEMVFLALATGFVVAVLRYGETPTLGRFGMVFLCGLLASLIKLPAFSHLGLLAVALLWRTQGFRFLFRPAHWIAAVLLLLAIKGWSGYVTAVNAAGFPEWTSESTLRLFFGDPLARLRPSLYIKVTGYVTAFLLSPLGLVLAGIGLWRAFLSRGTDKGFFVLAWTASLVFYVLVWGTQTSGAHSYYNLPMLIPAAMLFGMGMGAVQEWIEGAKSGKRKAESGNLESAPSDGQSAISSRGIIFCSIVAVLILIPMAVMTSYLFQEDHVLLVAANWICENVQQGQPVAIKLNHSPYYIDYTQVPVVAYYSGHPCFMLSRHTPDSEYTSAMEQCHVIVETLPVNKDGMRSFAIALKGAERPVDKLERARAAGFVPEAETADGLRIWKKK